MFRPASTLLHNGEDDKEFEVTLSSLVKQEHKRKKRRKSQSSIDSKLHERLLQSQLKFENKENMDSQASEESTTTVKIEKTEEPEETENSTATKTRLDNNNIVSKLLHRCTHGRRIKPPNRLTQCWSLSSTVSLHAKKLQRGTTCFAWDRHGVLLAMANAHSILIWDWDMVVASHLMQSKKSDKTKGRRRLSPVCEFSTPWPVSCIKWRNDQELVVGFRTTSCVYSYNVERIASNTKYSPGTSPPSSCMQKLSVHETNKGVCNLLVLQDGHLMVVSHFDGTLVLWKNCVIQWTTKMEFCMTAMANMSISNLVVLGSEHGTITILNIKKCTRTAFSTRLTPVIIGQWETSTQVFKEQAALPPRKWMGVSTFVATRQQQGNHDCSLETITWITLCGWILQLSLTNGGSTLIEAKVLQRTPEEQLKTDNEITVRPGTFSMPQEPTPSDCDASTLWFRKVPPTIYTRPPRDQQILVVPTVLRSEQQKQYDLAWYDGTSTFHTVGVGHDVNAISVHPHGKEWIVVATGGKIRILHNRRKNLEHVSRTTQGETLNKEVPQSGGSN